MRRVLLTMLAAMMFASACGGAPPPVDKDQIRKNADDADRDLDRESAKKN